MRKQRRKKENLLLYSTASTAIILLSTAFILFGMTPPGNIPQPAAAHSIVLHQTDSIHINSISVSNTHGSYTALNLGNKFQPQHREGIPYDKDAMDRLVSAAATITANRQIKDTANLARYGLSSPIATVKIEYITGETATLKIGDKVDAGYYVQTSSGVYVMDTQYIDPFLMKEDSLIDRHLTPDFNSDLAISQILLAGRVRPLPITIRYDGDSCTSLTPITQTIPTNKAQELAMSPYGLVGDFVAKVNPSHKDMERYGLARPYSVISVYSQMGSLSLAASQPENGICYVVASEIPVIYGVSASKLPWLSTQLPILTGRIFQRVPISEVAAVSVSTTEGSFAYKLTHGESGYNVKLDGALVPVAAFEKMYDAIGEIIPTDYTYITRPTSLPLLKIRIVYSGEGSEDVISLYPSENGRVHIGYGGDLSYTTEAEVVQRIIESLPKAAPPEEESQSKIASTDENDQSKGEEIPPKAAATEDESKPKPAPPSESTTPAVPEEESPPSSTVAEEDTPPETVVSDEANPPNTAVSDADSPTDTARSPDASADTDAITE